MKIGLVQFAPAWEDPDKSISKLEALLSKTDNDYDLLIFPEMTLTGFTMNSAKFSETIDGAGTQLFINISSMLGSNIFAGLIEQDKMNYYNTLVHFDGMGLIKARYRKIHPFSLGQENLNYRSSKEIVMTEIDNVKVGLSICYDLRFPELYRLYSKKGAQLLINIANWPVQRIEHWKTLLRARAIENQCFMIGANRIGEDPQNKYNGCSAVFDPMGNCYLMKENEEKIFECDIDPNLVSEIRNQFPFLDDIKLI